MLRGTISHAARTTAATPHPAGYAAANPLESLQTTLRTMKINPDLHSAFDAVLLKALAVKAIDRFTNAQDFATAMDAAAAQGQTKRRAQASAPASEKRARKPTTTAAGDRPL